MEVIEILTMYLKRLKRIEYRESLLKQLLGNIMFDADFREERSCHRRILFLDICNVILSHFSRKFFRDHFYDHYLAFSRDPVANIRLRFIAMLPTVRRTLRQPLDAIYIQKLSDSIEPLMSRDTAPDVIVLMNHVQAIYGPFDSRFVPQSANAEDSDFGMHIGKKSVVKRSISASSLTDVYLLKSPEQIIAATEKEDKEREEEEAKISFEIPGPDWGSKKSNHDAHRRYGDKKPTVASRKMSDLRSKTYYPVLNANPKKLVFVNTSALHSGVKFQPSAVSRVDCPQVMTSSASNTATSPGSSLRLRRMTNPAGDIAKEFANYASNDAKQAEAELTKNSFKLPLKPLAALRKLSAKDLGKEPQMVLAKA
jgi:hypothetical protein